MPKVSCFTLEFENLPSLAPGMTQTSYIYFKKGEDAQEYVDSITVSVGQEKYGIRLEALAKYGELYVAQQQVDFGTICAGANFTQQIVLQNVGCDPDEI